MDAKQRLQRLLDYLDQDPSNDRLREDAIVTACDAEEAAIARRLLDERSESASASLLKPWAFLGARVALAERDWESALRQWLSLAEEAELPLPDRQHARACAVHLQLRLGRVAAAAATLAPELEQVQAGEPLPDLLQAAWLRVEHHAGRLSEGLDWALAREAQGQLAAEAAGVASMIAMDLGDLPTCDRLSRVALAQHADQGEALLASAALSLFSQDPTEALALNERVAAARPESGRAWTQLGAARLLAMDLQGARVGYARATDLLPGHAGSWHGLAWTQLLLGDLVEAERLLDHALELDRNFAETHGALAVVYAKTGRRQMAQESLRRAQGLDAGSFSVQYAQALLQNPELSGEDLITLATRLLDGQRMPDGRRASTLLKAALRR